MANKKIQTWKNLMDESTGSDSIRVHVSHEFPKEPTESGAHFENGNEDSRRDGNGTRNYRPDELKEKINICFVKMNFYTDLYSYNVI